MAISFRCPHCKEVIEVEKRLAGQFSTCSGCGKPIEIPTLEWLRRESAKKRESVEKPEPQTPVLPPAVSAYPQGPSDPQVSEQELLLQGIDKELQEIGKDVDNIDENLGCIFAMLFFSLICSIIAGLIAIGQH